MRVLSRCPLSEALLRTPQDRFIHLAYTRPETAGGEVDALGFGPLLAWVYGVIANLLGPTLSWLALPATYLLYGAGVTAVLTGTRRIWRRFTDKWLLMRAPLRRIWRDFSRKPGHALELSKRLLRESQVSPLAPALSVGQSLLWFFAVRNAVVPWQDSGFREAVGQVPTQFLGMSTDLSGFSEPTVWLTYLVGVMLVWFTSYSTFTQVRERMRRRAWLLQQFPARWTTLIPLGVTACYLLLLFQLTTWVPPLPEVWSVTILASMFLPAHAFARWADKRREPLGVTIPEWMWHQQLPSPSPRPRTRIASRPAAAPVESASPTMVDESHSVDPTRVEPVAEPVFAQPLPAAERGATTVYQPLSTTVAAVSTPAPTKVMADDWGALAPTPRPLGPHEPSQLGDYAITGRVGSGGMAIVYLASKPNYGQLALKVANPLTSVTNATSRLMHEIATLSQVSDNAVVQIHDSGVIDDHPFIAMDYLRGPTLHEAIREVGPLRNREALRALGESLARGLAAIHRVGVHRDVKPANIILTDRGPVIVDLGIAKLRGVTTELTREGTALGTVGYSGPEILMGRDASPASDIFAWGACMAFAATGRPLFGGGTIAAQLDAIRSGRADDTVMQELADVDAAAAHIVARCTNPDPARRPADGAELLRIIPIGARWLSPQSATQ